MSLDSILQFIRRRAILPLVILSCCTALLSFPLTSSLWLDESVSSWIVSSDFGTLLTRVRDYQGQSPLYFIVLYYWSQIVGNSELALRTLSLLGAVATLICVWKIADELRDRETAVLSVIIILALDWFIKASVNVRPYSLALLSVTFATWYFLRWIRSDRYVDLLGWCAGVVLGFYFHYFFGAILIVHGCIFLLTPPDTRRRRLGVLSAALIVIVFSWSSGISHLAELAGREGLYSFTRLPGVVDLLKSIFSPAALVLIGTALLCARIAQPFSWERFAPVERRKLLWLICWATLPPLLFFTVSLLSGDSLFFWRFMVWSTPGFAIATAYLLRRTGPENARTMVFAVLALLIILIPRTWVLEDWRGAGLKAEKLLREKPGRGLLIYPGFIELEQVSFLTDPRHREYLLAPFDRYPVARASELIPSGFERPDHAQFFTERIEPYLAAHSEVVLIVQRLRQFENPELVTEQYFAKFFERKGYLVQDIQGEGMVKVLLLKRPETALRDSTEAAPI